MGLFKRPRWTRALRIKSPRFGRRYAKYDGSPNTALTAPKGSLCWDYTNSDMYVNTDGATAWTKIVD